MASRNFRVYQKLTIILKKKLDNLRKSSAVVAVSGGPDSLALAALTKAYTSKKKNQILLCFN